MQTIRTHNQIERALATLLQLHPDAVFALLQTADLISEYYFSAVLDSFEQQTRQRATRNGHITASRQLQQSSRSEASDTFTPFIDNPHLMDVVANAAEFIGESHALSYVITESPKIDDIATAPWRWRMLNQCRLEAVRLHPEGEGWPGNPET